MTRCCRLALPAILATASTVSAQDYVIDWDAVSQGGAVASEMLDAYQRGDLPALSFSPEELTSLFSKVEQALAGRDLADLDSLKPAIPQLLVALNETEAGAAYADWLLQRYDYMVVASWARSQIPAQPPAAGPTPAVPAATQRRNYVTNLDVWKHRIAKRAAPTRADQWLADLKQIFREGNVPEDLVWLAEVESSFNPVARSPVGAVGLFQFMPKTGEWMGLSLEPEDERTDPLKSARAAAKYLRYLHGIFKDWPLALAAYNWGQGNLKRALEESGASTFNEIIDRLPNETRMYVPKIFATIEVREGRPFQDQ